MGSAQSNEEYVDKILENVNKTASEGKSAHIFRNYITVDELIHIIPPRDYPLDLQHLGIIHKIDSHRSGSFTRDELLAFVNFYVSFRALDKSVDADSKFQAYCTLQLWNSIAADGGAEEFELWVCSLLAFNDRLGRKHLVAESRDKNGVPRYISKASIRTLHRLFNDRGGLGKDARGVCYPLRGAAHERQQGQSQQGQPLSASSKYDEYIPTDVIRLFIQSFVKGFKEFMETLGFHPNIPLDA